MYRAVNEGKDGPRLWGARVISEMRDPRILPLQTTQEGSIDSCVHAWYGLGQMRDGVH
jgi:hypothetical protein